MLAPKHNDITGILVALITPFKPDGSVNETALAEHVNRQIEAGVHGLVPGGSTGDFTALTVQERKTVIEVCVKAAAGRVPVIAGAGDLTTTGAIDHAVHAAKVGAKAVMVVPPFYDPPNLQQLRSLLQEIHSASGLPIVYYNIPSASGVNLSVEEVAGLSEVGVKYMKDTSGNAPALTELLLTTGDRITTFNGWDTLTFYGLAAGATGSVWGATNIIPELSVELWNALAVENDIQKGREVWAKIWPITKFLESHHYSSAVKTGMEVRGWKTGGVRKPFALLEDNHKAELAALLKKAGVPL
ncbi:4-hydroxy-tetrahydrodipicolinate synthase [Colletotrichum aenigma]|uniref:4-hydroxy-tetrahydrodipicolinate synthase n=1 Tax=Colletotrichum aenigma TaxID=1215731 RepID=UPI00187232C2|nr:4-hydroxy-tetrahydrodipicolinate synthase [Colletotrichum aenigma]KAF5502829.1 4-hydroxy-tetrahydrodipicolinate synthase [Colletotrichum aenigma]